MSKKAVKKIVRLVLAPLAILDYWRFKMLDKKRRFPLNLKDIYPCVKDKTISTGFDRHYVYHTAWAARKVREINPKFHIDISSSLYFSSIVSAFVPVKFYDYRPPNLELDNLSVEKANILSLPFGDSSVSSLSCMHTVEHICLGRYGDAIDPDGDIKAIRELKRVLAPGGNLLFVVPIGKSRIEFNAHRVYSYGQIMEYFAGLNLREFTLIPEKNGGMIINASLEQAAAEYYGCGCFWFVKQ